MVFDNELYSGFLEKFNNGFLCEDAEEFLAGFDEVDLSMMEDYLNELGGNFPKLYKQFQQDEDEEFIKEETIKLALCGVISEYCREGDYIEVLNMAAILKLIV